ncbi:hypothetical protein J2W22_002938 [Sphingomonas kyeonggiensis]|uniref:YobI family P-loop NTPase n=1 Tax=Sphingomonas kyeonggiensis TaxID=1268553 RepID=UPI0027883FFC|nr:P-loop NTPase fold protein [Sphingomonas kyeonggiensis]MDQ0250874.1 hypothetical protein [Sphingomonas kyeonggiensis]
MKERLITLAHWFAGQLQAVAAMLEGVGIPASTQSKFVDLAPTDQADKAGVYAEALLYATSNKKVFNIALTGPYGSGKSSIIQSFLKRYRRRTLHISLAAFAPEGDTRGESVSRQEIERSILQQMLYGADANRLPLSRFKRIQSPGVWSIFKSLFIMIGLLALWHMFQQYKAIISGAFFTPFALGNWLNLGSFAVAASFLWIMLHHFYVASFGVSLKSISLKDIEIRPASDNLESILNRHLDEIIYFFQSTDYDLVIIEDLDRFNNTEIFVTLREINSLVNENAGVKRTIRFLYALRDDMFVNTDRTKFFEFIIPVIPIINASNSIDMVLEQGKRLALDGRLDRQFLREVSRYLNDLRLIQNIFNEYAIYVANLETDHDNLLDANKLLAILIYKNVYPRDFERLHRGEGNFAGVLKRETDLVAQGEAAYRSEIAELEQRLEIAERQTPADLKELRRIYAMALFEGLPAGVLSISFDGQTWIAPSELVGADGFERWIDAPQLTYRNIHGHQQRNPIATWQADVDPHRSYQQRRAEIDNKAANNKNESLRRISELRSKIGTLRTTKLNELMRLNSDRLEDLFESFGEKGELARFLILEGYLDDTYYQYTSLFHSGRLSPHDNKFLIQIRAFTTPDPEFPIDNPKEVIVAMRDEDFRQSYVLNVKLADCLLSDRFRYAEQTAKLFEFLSANFESCEAFFDAYYAGGRDVAGLLSGLAGAWQEYAPTIIASPRSLSHVTQLLSSVPEKLLERLARDNDELAEFVSANLPEILAQAPEMTPERLERVGFEVRDLASIKEHPGIIRAMFENGLFELTIANLEYAYQEVMGEPDLESLRARNYTTIRSANNAVLIDRIERDFDTYLHDVLLGLDDNSTEDAAAILAIILHENLDQEDLEEFLGRQTVLLPTLADVPSKAHAMLFQQRAIEPTWANCLAFIESEGFEPESLIAYLNREDVRAAIVREPMPSNSAAQPLRKFLIGAAALSDAAYKEYVEALPKPFDNFPEGLDRAKLGILIEERKVTFDKASLDALAPEPELQLLFVAANVAAYLADPQSFALDDEFRERLLRTEIGDGNKRALVDLMDLGALPGLPERAALIGPVIDRSGTGIAGLDAGLAQTLITHSKPISTQISLFNKFHSVLADSEVRQVLETLPRPFSEIRTGYSSPRLTNTTENIALVKWLDSRNIISSWSEGTLFTDDIRVNLKRR